MNILINTGVAV